MNPILQKLVSVLYEAARFPWFSTMLGPDAVKGIDVMEAVQPSLAALMVTPEWVAFVGALGAALNAQMVTTAVPIKRPASSSPITYEAPPAIFPWDHR